VAVRDRAVAGSGAYLRHFEAGGRTYGHIIDPRTGYPVDNGCRAVTVIAPTCTEAGVLSTAAFVLGPQEGLALIESHYGAEGCVWTERELMTTGGFDDYLIR
jgi:thiamine biosynthesis lipoprotein